MILEGIVTTLSPEGEINVAPMGPRVTPAMDRLVLRPFRTAHTYQNLKAHGEGVFHVTDDVLLLARTAVGTVNPLPPMMPAQHVRGSVLLDACRYYEFRVLSVDDRQERSRFETLVVHSGRLRDFVGFNRGKNAVLEAAILATRISILPFPEIEAEFRRLHVLVEKTGGAEEKEAFAFLTEYVERTRRGEAARGPES
jgi:uncharacterized protein